MMTAERQSPPSVETPLRATFAAIVGSAHVTDDADARALFSQDIWAPGAATAALIVAPGTLDEVAKVVAAAHAAGYAVAPRGAGMSYTAGYVPVAAETVLIDMARMDRIIAIRPDDMTVTVEAGCSWHALNEALKPHGLRTPFWGPMSGLVSTIGGGLSQLNAMLGAGHHGTSSESVVALTVVLGDGRVLRTGGADQPGLDPFYRHYGPDLVGLFCGDCGAMGIKVEITLRLMRLPAHEAYASFSFPTGADLIKAMAEMARAGIACEMCAFDPGLTKMRLARASLMSDVKTLGAVVMKQKSLVKGVIEGAKVVMGGRSFIAEEEYPLHVICEGRSAAAVAADLEEGRRIAAAHGGHEIENTIAKVIRAIPFPPLNSVLGPAGERWAPIHGVSALSRAPQVLAGIQAVFADMAPAFEAHGISTGFLFSSMSTNGLVIEPVFYWPHQRLPIHAVAMEPSFLAKLPSLEANPAATDVVKAARARVLEVFSRHGCTHFQIGRVYPYRQSRDAVAWDLLATIKGAVDPGGRVNPGVLGLTGDAAQNPGA